MAGQKKLAPTILFIFGGSGDLTSRKLIPALYNLFLDDYLPEEFAVIGAGRTDFSDDKYRDSLLEAAKQFSRRKEELNDRWKKFASNIFYHNLDLTNDASYKNIIADIKEKTKDWGEPPVIIYYL